MNAKNTPLYVKRTLIVGAKSNGSGYAALAYHRLRDSGHEIVLLGRRKGIYDGTEILDIYEKPAISGIDTITLYINPDNQQPWLEYLIGLKPSRIIFNPGTENPVLEKMAEENGIETVYGCTLVMLSIGVY